MATTRQVRAVRRFPKRLGDIISTELATIGPKVAASVAWEQMRGRGVRHLLVTESGRPLGILSERSLGGQNNSGEARRGRMVEDLMIPHVASAESTATLSRAANLIQGKRAGCLLVTDGGHPMGIVPASDVFEELGRDPLRAPLPGWLPRSAKLESSAHARAVPAHIRVLGTKLDKDQREYIRQELGTRLGKFSDSIERVSVRVEDVNGPRGGIDQVCRIKVVLSNLPSVVFESQDASLNIAVRDSLAGAERAVRRTLQRRRMKPIKIGARSAIRPS